MILLVGDLETLSDHVEEIPPMARELIKVAVKPLTIVYPKGTGLARELLGKDGSVGIRLTRERFSKQLCASFGKPIVSTSANISGIPAPQTFAQISDEIKNSVDYIVRYGRDDARPHAPSSIISLDSQGRIKIIRN